MALPSDLQTACQIILKYHTPGLGIEKCVEEYDKRKQVEEFFDAVHKMKYTGPNYCADMVAFVLGDRKDALVLDLCAGSGLVGEQLYKHGFKNLVAHDGAETMLDMCREKKIYSRFIRCLIFDDTVLPEETDTYDAVAISGGVCENHLPPSVQRELIRVTIPGGFVVNTYRSSMLDLDYGQSWENQGKQLVEENLWRMYGRLIVPAYLHSVEGYVDMYQVCKLRNGL